MADHVSIRASRGALNTWSAALAYLAVFFGMWLGPHVLAAPLAVVPILVAAFYFGLPGGLAVSCGLALVHTAVLLASGVGTAMGYRVLGANVVLIAVGAAFGFVREKARARVEQQRTSAQRYELAARSTSDGLWDWNLKTDDVYFSDSFAQLLGYAPAEIGRTPQEWLGRVHPDDLAAVRGSIDQHLAGSSRRFESEHRLRRKDGSWLWVLARGIASQTGPDGGRRITGWLTDISERKRSEDNLRHHAFHDPLTGLPNRSLFLDRLTHALARARRNPSHRFAVMFLDLDHFKSVNDRLGHLAGDELLVSVGHRLERSVRPGDTVARLGGDEFALLLEDVPSPGDALAAGERVQRALSTPLPLAGQDLLTRASIGVALGDSGVLRPDELLRKADTAMYESKTQPGGRPVLFDPHMHDKAVERAEMEAALRTAIERRELLLHYQPIVDLATGGMLGFEALVRWRHPTLGLISPLSFIPLAEETGLISDLGAWVLLESLGQARRWQDQFRPDRPLQISVNLSVRQLQSDPKLVERVKQALETTGVAPASLVLEVTESIVMQDAEAGAQLLSELRKHGVRVCMDDFGTGYSSLSYLHRVRVDALKIDISFIRNLGDETSHSEIVRTILTLAKTLGLSAIAEGVETEVQRARLKELGCAAAQGYLFSAPVDAATVEVLLRNETRW